MRKQPPNSFTIFGGKWSVKFQDPERVPRALSRNERRFMRSRGLNLWGLTIAARTTGRRDIYIDPRARTDWTLFAHELLHACFAEMREHKRVKGWRREPIDHGTLDKIAEPLGQFLKENLR